MPTRIAHFTDIHVTAPPSALRWRDLVSKRALGWLNLRCGRGRAFAGAVEVLSALAADLEEVGPDLVLFTGDVTALSLPQEFEAAREALGPLAGSGRVIGIPGNHDVYVPEAERARLFERFFGDWTRTDLAAGDLPRELRAGYPYPLLELAGEGDGAVAIICLRDARPAALHDSSGEVGEGQLAALEHVLGLPAVACRTRILALHYGLVRADGTPDTRFHGLRDAPRLLELIDRHAVHLVVHGHIHRRFVHASGIVSVAAVADPGALTYAPGVRAYHVYAVGGGAISLEARRYDEAARAFRPWPHAPGTGEIAVTTLPPGRQRPQPAAE